MSPEITQTNKLDLKNQETQFSAVRTQFTKWRELLADRKIIYDKLPPEAQKKWRENPKDSVLSETWTEFLALADWFGVEIQK